MENSGGGQADSGERLTSTITPENVRAVLGKMLNLKLIVMLREPAAKPMRDVDLSEHLSWMIAKEKEGKVFASGPFVSSNAALGSTGGMTILRVRDLEQAREVAESDPLVENGIVRYQLREWLLMEGGVTVKLSFSDGAGSLL